jgi:hypothetical protein
VTHLGSYDKVSHCPLSPFLTYLPTIRYRSPISWATWVVTPLGHDIILRSWSSALLDNPSVMQLHKSLPTFYGTRKCITVLTTALHRSLPWASSIQSVTHNRVSLISTAILSTHTGLGLPSNLFPYGFLTILLDPIILIISGEEYKLWSSPFINIVTSQKTHYAMKSA